MHARQNMCPHTVAATALSLPTAEAGRLRPLPFRFGAAADDAETEESTLASGDALEEDPEDASPPAASFATENKFSRHTGHSRRVGALLADDELLPFPTADASSVVVG